MKNIDWIMEQKEWDRLADEYFDNVTSPFEKGVTNPIPKIVGEIKDRKSLDAVDLGTGIGNFLPFLEKNFQSVVGVDFSQKMVEAAAKKAKKKSTRVIKKDLRNLSGLYSKFDVAFAINSILMPSVMDIRKSLSETRKVLKKNGRLIAAFPSMDSVLYKAMLAYDHERSMKNRRSARKKVAKEIEEEKFDFMLGFMDEEGEQKHFYKFEIKHRLREAGFKNIEFSKIEYPWEIFCEEYFMKFKNKPKMWDWVVEAKK